MKRKKIDFEEHKRWLESQPKSLTNRINEVWKQYIRWEDPDKIIDKMERLRMKEVFVIGVIVGLIDID